ncbi:MAG: phosphodiester glycosidase family protein [Patescibacteria group bacterium]
MKRIATPLLIVTVLFMGWGCVRGGATQPVVSSRSSLLAPRSSSTTTAEAAIPFTWSSIGDGAERGEKTIPNGEYTAHLIAYRFDPKKYDFHFAQTDQPKLVSAWMQENSTASFIINGVYFQEDHSPAGMLRIDNTNVGSRSFDAKKSGLIIFGSDGNRIMDTSVNNVKDPKASNEAQSYPFLIKNGSPAIQDDSGLVARRSFIGIDIDGKIIFGAYVGGEISLSSLSQLLATLPVTWTNAINLDGGASTGFSANISGYQELEDSYVDIPNVIEVEKR